MDMDAMNADKGSMQTMPSPQARALKDKKEKKVKASRGGGMGFGS